MKILIQRSKQSSVKVENEIVGKIDHGMVVFICFEQEDTEEKIDMAIHKLINLRIFEDENNKMTYNILQTKGSILSVSQFTLSWDGSGGHRPSFDRSMSPNQAKLFYAIFNKKLKEHLPVETGIFGAMMEVAITNDGPVTFHLNF